MFDLMNSKIKLCEDIPQSQRRLEEVQHPQKEMQGQQAYAEVIPIEAYQELRKPRKK